MDISRSFYIRVDETGKQTPIMEFFPPQYSMLSHLGFDDFNKSKTITDILKNIENALFENKEYTFASDDWCIVKTNGAKSIVSNGFDEFKPFELKTDFFIILFEDWRDFLIKYEAGKIKGLS
jgi:hypothetical protein